MAIRIDTLVPNSQVTLNFSGRTEPATFIRIEGEGETRNAIFETQDSAGPWQWAAYRFGNRWAYGSSAMRLSVVSIDQVPEATDPRDDLIQRIRELTHDRMTDNDGSSSEEYWAGQYHLALTISEMIEAHDEENRK